MRDHLARSAQCQRGGGIGGRGWRAGAVRAVALATLFAAANAVAQPGAPAAAPDAGEGAVPVQRAVPAPGTREDLARAYLRLERALATTDLAEADLKRVNELFDRASMRLYGAGYRTALRLINDAWVVASMRQLGEDRQRSLLEARQRLSAAGSVRVAAEPAVALADADAVTLRLRTLYDWTGNAQLAGQGQRRVAQEGMQLKLIVHQPGAEAPLLVQPVRVLPDRVEPATITLALPRGGVKPGAAMIALEAMEGVAVEVGVARFAQRSLDAVRAETLARLDELEAQALQAAMGERARRDNLRLARRMLRARAQLLTDAPSPNETAEFLQDPAALARQVQRELEALERGEDPYWRQLGDRWQVILARGIAYPARVFAPQAAGAGEPLPLVIAFHGAGGDENLFMDGYGAGRLKDLAAERGFLLVTPRTSPFASSPVFLEGLIETIETHYAVDRNRVYVMGHSLGAGVTAGLARLAHDTIAACVCLAGGGAFETNGGSAPTLVYAAELDPIIPAWRTIEGAQRAKQGGLPIECKLAPNRGHTLFIGDVLDEAVEWLFAHSLADRDGEATRGVEAP